MVSGKNTPILPLFASILVLFPVLTQSQLLPLPPPRPLCASQYSLANYACIRLPYTPTPPPSPPSPPSPLPPPPSPPSPPSPEENGHHRHNHRHHHGHRHGAVHQETEVEAECCKWLKQVDPECVCELLLHLPLFLARPLHNYTVEVDETCKVTFPCGGRIIR